MSEKEVKKEVKEVKPPVEKDLRVEIARMEKEKRDAMAKKAAALKPKVAPKVEEKPAGISFKLWWVGISKKRSLPAYLKEIVWADFQARGLTEKEEKAKYDQAIELFGYKA